MLVATLVVASDNYAVLQFMLKRWPPNDLPSALVDAGLQRCTHSYFCAGSVDLLRHSFRLVAEWGRVGDLVAVSVGGDSHSAASPLVPLPPIGGSVRRAVCGGLVVFISGWFCRTVR